jgi:hypothetical protein
LLLEDIVFRKKHSRDYFYKYTNANTAKAILSSSSFRYSSPLIFNDPFDNQAGMQIEFNVEEFVDLFFDKFEELVLAEKEPTFEEFNKISEVIMLRRSEAKVNGFSKQNEKNQSGHFVKAIAENTVDTYHALIKCWKNDLKRMRIFCVSEEYDNILMWSHYADFHKGVVIKLKVADNKEDDDPLWLAQPVKYVPKSLPLFTSAQVEDALGVIKYNFNSLFEMFTYRKFDIWKYEKEWRLFTLEDNESALGYNDYNFKFNKIDTIIFGCNSTESDINEIVTIVKSKNKDVHYLKAKKHKYEYKLLFEELKT